MFNNRLSIAVSILFASFSYIFSGCSSETQEQAVTRIESDASLDDETRIKKLAKAIFRVKSCEVIKDAKGSHQIQLVIFGEDTSSFAKGDTSGFKGGLNATEKRLNLMRHYDPMAVFLKKIRSRNVTDVSMTLQTPLFGSNGTISEWVDTYTYRLPVQSFAQFLEAGTISSEEQRMSVVEQIWKIELDRFNEFAFKKKDD